MGDKEIAILEVKVKLNPIKNFTQYNQVSQMCADVEDYGDSQLESEEDVSELQCSHCRKSLTKRLFTAHIQSRLCQQLRDAEQEFNTGLDAELVLSAIGPGWRSPTLNDGA
uniref:C2H2-type domain-containing protein n=1 Tax=Rhabditophanes sp. KR3021 TaxID=114890 RepID=A0AC35UBY6_9BILA